MKALVRSFRMLQFPLLGDPSTKRYSAILAEGKIPLVQKDIPISSTHLAKHLGNKNYRPYITDSVSDINKNSDKNIFNYPNKLIEIKDYCNESRIEICESFLKIIDSIIGD